MKKQAIAMKTGRCLSQYLSELRMLLSQPSLGWACQIQCPKNKSSSNISFFHKTLLWKNWSATFVSEKKNELQTFKFQIVCSIKIELRHSWSEKIWHKKICSDLGSRNSRQGFCRVKILKFMLGHFLLFWIFEIFKWPKVWVNPQQFQILFHKN